MFIQHHFYKKKISKFKKLLFSFLVFTLVVAPFNYSFLNPISIKAQEPFATIDQDTIWTKANSPYIISQNTLVSSGVTLMIEPGAVIKFKQYISLRISGKLIAKGTPAEKIIFTSFLDDQAGGDSNQDRNSALPQPGDWGFLSFYTPPQTLEADKAKGELDNVVINYGGLILMSAPILVKNKNNYFNRALAQEMIPQSTGVLSLRGAQVVVNNSFIAKNKQGVDVFNSSHWDWDSEIPGLDSNLEIHNSEIYDNQDYAILNDYYQTNYVDARNNWWGDATGPYHETLNQEGLGGAVFGNLLFFPWLDKSVVEPRTDPVILIPGIMGSWVWAGKLYLDPILHTYDQLYENLQRYGGYKDGETLFDFPYDWTFSNTTTAELLKNKIEEVKSICHCEKVDLVAHSMGGLVARYYIESDLYQDDVDQLIFIATPHLGSPKGYLVWEGGDMGVNWTDTIQELFLNQVAEVSGFDSIYEYVRNLPVSSAQQLLPIYDYLQDNDTGLLRSYPNNYPVNEFLEELNAESNLNKLYNKVRITNIYGDLENKGIDRIRVAPQTPEQDPLWEYGYPEHYNSIFGDHGLIMTNGDRTVPIKSAMAIQAEKTKRLFTDHQNIVSYSSNYVLDTLQNKWVDIVIKDQPEQYLIIQVHSPVDFVVFAPDGKKIGKNFSQNISVNEIEDAFYSGFDTEAEFAVIPNPISGEYQVQIIGLDQGSYRLEVNYVDTGREIGSSQSFTANVAPERIDNFKIEYNPNNPEEILGNLTPDDVTPPEISINSPEEKEYPHSEIIPIDFQITDDFIGVATTTMQLDGEIFTGDKIDLFFYHLGEHIFKIQTQDKAGNSADREIKFQVVANIESLISDISRSYEEKWIKNAKSRDSLIKDALKARKWYNNLERVKERIKNHKAKDILSEIQVKIFLRSFKQNLKNLLKRGLVNQQAYDLLLEQADYIINNL